MKIELCPRKTTRTSKFYLKDLLKRISTRFDARVYKLSYMDKKGNLLPISEDGELLHALMCVSSAELYACASATKNAISENGADPKEHTKAINLGCSCTAIKDARSASAKESESQISIFGEGCTVSGEECNCNVSQKAVVDHGEKVQRTHATGQGKKKKEFVRQTGKTDKAATDRKDAKTSGNKGKQVADHGRQQKSKASEKKGKVVVNPSEGEQTKCSEKKGKVTFVQENEKYDKKTSAKKGEAINNHGEKRKSKAAAQKAKNDIDQAGKQKTRSPSVSHDKKVAAQNKKEGEKKGKEEKAVNDCTRSEARKSAVRRCPDRDSCQLFCITKHASDEEAQQSKVEVQIPSAPLELGDCGSNVKLLQIRLSQIGFVRLRDLPSLGLYCSETHKAVKAFRSEYSISGEGGYNESCSRMLKYLICMGKGKL